MFKASRASRAATKLSLCLITARKLWRESFLAKAEPSVNGLPVFDTVSETVDAYSPNASIIFVPAPFAQDAVLEAIANKIKTVVVITEHMPIRDTINILGYAAQSQVTVVGPNTPGIITPGECKLGIMPAEVFAPGSVGLGLKKRHFNLRNSR